MRPVSPKVGTGDFALATGHRLNAISLLTGRSLSGAPRTIYLKYPTVNLRSPALITKHTFSPGVLALETSR
jgi:hypothetical protein